MQNFTKVIDSNKACEAPLKLGILQSLARNRKSISPTQDVSTI